MYVVEIKLLLTQHIDLTLQHGRLIEMQGLDNVDLGKVDQHNVNHSTDLTPKHLPGFADRLDILLRHAHIKDYGRLSLLARETGLTAGGVRLMFTADRPPKQKRVYNSLLAALYGFLEIDNNQAINQEDLSNYLLLGKGDPLNITGSADIERLINSVDAVYIGKIYLGIDKVASNINIDLYNDIETDTLREVYVRIIRYCVDNNIDTESDALEELIASSIKLAKANLL